MIRSVPVNAAMLAVKLGVMTPFFCFEKALPSFALFNRRVAIGDAYSDPAIRRTKGLGWFEGHSKPHARSALRIIDAGWNCASAGRVICGFQSKQRIS
jgi:hypothetical protein